MTKAIPFIERVAEVTPEVARGVGDLMPDLSSRLPADPIDVELLESIVTSPDRDLIVARLNGHIVGSAVMNLIVFTSGKKAWLEDFVVSSEVDIRGSGVGFALWQELVAWSKERNAPIEFTSHPDRKQAHEFYHRQGAEIKPTSVFHYEV